MQTCTQLFSALLALGVLTSCQPCPPSCHVANVIVTVSDAAGAAINDVQATLESSTADPRTSACEIRANETMCFIGVSGGGSYTLKVRAPGFRELSVPATISYSRDPACGCPGASIEPAQVTLDPS